MTYQGWDQLLGSEEEILWTGKPNHVVRFEYAGWFDLMLGASFIAFSLVVIFDPKAKEPFVWLFLLPFLAFGFYKLVGVHFWKAHLRKNTLYALTTKRALISTRNFFGRRRIESYPITKDTPITLLDGRNSTVNFATKKPSHMFNFDQADTPVGFQLISDGQKIFVLMRDIQEAA